jgi:hypothetical protein
MKCTLYDLLKIDAAEGNGIVCNIGTPGNLRNHAKCFFVCTMLCTQAMKADMRVLYLYNGSEIRIIQIVMFRRK